MSANKCIIYLHKSEILLVVDLPLYHMNENFELSIMKAFEEKKLIMDQIQRFIYERVENVLEKGEEAGCQHFLLFPKSFKSLLPKGYLRHIIDCSKLKEFADDNFIFYEKCIKFSK